ncbi:MAG TPA: tetratricopeptide repeat protein, partial [Verrucomicrobiota bacterium]|nr:tetratricopeptide repeat protein [Verrucomicrobiota bacterium]
ELETARQALEEANRKLAEQTRLAETLTSEKAALQSKLDSLAAQTVNTAELETARQALEEANRKLAEQTRLAEALTGEKESLQARVTALRTDAEAAAALRAENQLLKKQVADLQAAPAPASPAEELNRQLAQAQAQIAALQSDTEILRLEKSALADRVKQLSDAPAATAVTTRAADAARIKELERERDDLRRSLAVANKELYSRKGRAAAARLAGLEQQLATLRARLQVYEARQVPYTAEELALFRRPEPRLEQPVKRASRASAQELPAGTVALVAEAQRLHANREYAKAEEKYLQVLQQDRNNAPTLANLAAIELDQNHLAAAETNIMQAIALAPEDAFSQFVLGRLRFVQANYDEALDALSRAARLDPQDAQIQNFLGLTLSEKGLRGPAETALRKAIQLDPGYGNAHHNLAVIYLTQQPPLAELARWHYQKALAAGHSRNANLEKMIEARSAAPAP